jgi:signal transduction histidine kinase
MLRAFPFEEGDALMSVPLMLTFVSTVVFAIQLLIFVYLYSSHRVRFFQYLLLAWGAYTLSKGLRLVDALFLDIHRPSFVTDVATIAAVGFTLAAAFAHRWDYRLHGRDLLVGAGAVTVLALASDLGGNDEGQRIVGLALGVVQMAAGVLFWPARSTRFRGERLLSGLLTVWGLHRIATQFVNMEPGSTSYMAVHAVFITLYFLSTFAVIIMVLERARSESDRLHARLREVERLATAGELAAGMAHEIRNPLAAIVNATALLDDETGLTADERATTLAAIRTEARRLNRILSDFLHFARPQEARRVPGDIRQVVEHVSGLIRDGRSRASRVDVKVAFDPAVPRFAFDRDQLTQVLWNVALNGVEAMNGRGRLSLEVARQNGDIVLAVSDTGPGIPGERLAHVFEPFYSGKPSGSGLGLTIAERIMAAHGGRIEIDSEVGRGTRVSLLFPLEAA